MIGRILSCLFCLGKLKFTHFLGKKRVSENFWSKIWNPGRAIEHMLGQHLEYVSTFGEKCPPLVGRVNYDRPFMDHSGRYKDNWHLFLIKVRFQTNWGAPFVTPNIERFFGKFSSLVLLSWPTIGFLVQLQLRCLKHDPLIMTLGGTKGALQLVQTRRQIVLIYK